MHVARMGALKCIQCLLGKPERALDHSKRPRRRRELQRAIEFKTQIVAVWSGLIWLGILSSAGLL
jgi:hypothetical protein